MLQSTETCDLGITVDNWLNFNGQVSAVVYKAHVRAFLILQSYMSRDPIVLTKAFITYIRLILEWCCTPVWLPSTTCNTKNESCQQWFIKSIRTLANMTYQKLLWYLDLQSLQVRGIKCNLLM